MSAPQRGLATGKADTIIAHSHAMQGGRADDLCASFVSGRLTRLSIVDLNEDATCPCRTTWTHMSEISTELVSRLVTRRTSDGRCVYDGRNVAALRADERFGPHFRLRVGPGRAQRPIFVDELARLGWPMHEHGAGEDELLDLESLAQPAQQARPALEREPPVPI